MKKRTLLSVFPLILAASPAFAQAAAAAPPAAPEAAPPAPTPAPAVVVPAPEPAPPAPPLAPPAPIAAPEPAPTKDVQNTPTPASDRLVVSKTGFFQPSANIQLWLFGSHQNDDWTTTIRVRRAELRIKGEIVPKTFGYFVMIDPARALEAQNKSLTVTGQDPAPTKAGVVTALQPNGATSILQDVGVTWINDYADISIGQFKIPLSLEGSGSASKLYFPERALISRKYGDMRDFGVKAEKKFGKFGYTLGIYNGLGQNKLDGADHDQKDVALRLEAYPVEGLTLAAVGYTSIFDRANAGTKDRFEGDLKLDTSNFLLQAEYIHGWDTVGAAGATSRIEGQGFYVLAGYTFFDKLQPVVRIGSVDPEVGKDEHGSTAIDPNDEMTAYEFGANYYFKSHDAKLQLAGGFFDPEQRIQKTRFDLTLAAQLAF
jgi:hypothetical protein